MMYMDGASKKIIIICHEPLTIRIKSNFYIDNFINAGFDLEYWDLSQVIFPGIRLADQLDMPYVKKINDLILLEASLDLEEISNTIFIVEVNYSWSNRFLFKTLSDKGCYIVRIDMYGNTVLKIPFKDKLTELTISRIPKILNRQIQQKRFESFIRKNGMKGFDKIFSSSKFVINRVPINHPDYEAYQKSLVVKTENKHIVFLDVFFPLHPDLVFMYRTKRVSADAYQRSLCTFFDAIEKKYDLPVVIAAHPKSDYSGNEFGGRRILKGNTALLVREAAMVFLHSSNSVSSVILNDKPFELITNSEYNKIGLLRSAQKRLANTLDKHVYNIDKINVTDIEVRKMDTQIRQKYIYSYLTSEETQNASNANLITAELNKLSGVK